MTMYEEFVEFCQHKLKITLNTAQQLVTKRLLDDNYTQTWLRTPGGGKTTLFESLEQFLGAHIGRHDASAKVAVPKATEPPKKAEKPLMG